MNKKNTRKSSDAYISKEIKRIALKAAIMSMIHDGTTYSYAIMRKIEKHHFAGKSYAGKDIKNDVYNTIKALEHEGFIEEDVAKSTRMRKNYRITRRGANAVRAMRGVFGRAMKDFKDIMS